MSTPSMVLEKWLHKQFMEILSRGNASATQSLWPINQSSYGVDTLPTVAYSKCNGIRLVNINVTFESSLPFVYWNCFVSVPLFTCLYTSRKRCDLGRPRGTAAWQLSSYSASRAGELL